MQKRKLPKKYSVQKVFESIEEETSNNLAGKMTPQESNHKASIKDAASVQNKMTPVLSNFHENWTTLFLRMIDNKTARSLGKLNYND